jgi:hypothetical protein
MDALSTARQRWTALTLLAAIEFMLEDGQPDESHPEQLVPLVRGAGMDEHRSVERISKQRKADHPLY